MALTEKRKLFADEYLIDLNASRAYRVAYPRVKDGDTTGSGVTKSATEELAIKRAWAKKNCKMIEESVKQADQQLYKYILKAVTEEGITYKYLKTVMNIPAGRNYFYEKRRKFYYILSKKLDD